MKKSFFGTYSEFANEDTSPLSLFYKIDYNTIFSKHNFYLSTGYFREEASFIFNNQLDLDTSNITKPLTNGTSRYLATLWSSG